MKKIPLPRFVKQLLPFVLLGILGFGFVSLEVDPGGTLPSLPAGPGLTLDEAFNTEEGVRLVVGLKGWAEGTLTWQDVFGEKEDLGPNPAIGYHFPDHPPGGRVWLGFWHETASALFGTSENDPRVLIAYARLGSAAAFSLLVLIVGLISWRWYGKLAGLTAAGCLLLMPRVVGHAHLASLETVMNLTYTAAVLGVALWWKDPEDTATPLPRFYLTALAGVLWGLALLTKIQAVLIGPVVVVWAWKHWGRKAFVPLLIWGGAGLLVFYAGWPWLWLDPKQHALDYFRSSTERLTLYAWYFGERFADTQVPWHYPFVMFLITMPIGWLVLGVAGFATRDFRDFRDSRSRTLRRDGRLQLVLAAGLLPLVLFAVPGIAVYDGIRLFLVACPMWAIAVGRGAELGWRWLSRYIGRTAAGVVLGTVFLLHAYELWIVRPVYLSYYSIAVGGLPRAEAWGMEINYWGDSLTRPLWDEVASTVPEGGTVHVSPVLHPLQLTFLESQLPALKEKNIRLAPAVPEEIGTVRHLVVFRRQADLPPEVQNAADDVSPRFEIKRQGVRLGAFYHLAGDSR